jgi:hypothetical protein
MGLALVNKKIFLKICFGAILGPVVAAAVISLM